MLYVVKFANQHKFYEIFKKSYKTFKKILNNYVLLQLKRICLVMKHTINLTIFDVELICI